MLAFLIAYVHHHFRKRTNSKNTPCIYHTAPQDLAYCYLGRTYKLLFEPYIKYLNVYYPKHNCTFIMFLEDLCLKHTFVIWISHAYDGYELFMLCTLHAKSLCFIPIWPFTKTNTKRWQLITYRKCMLL